MDIIMIEPVRASRVRFLPKHHPFLALGMVVSWEETPHIVKGLSFLCIR